MSAAPEVMFHVRVRQPLEHCVRLLRKAVGQGARVRVLANEADAHWLDAALWPLPGADFLPHALWSPNLAQAEWYPILIDSRGDAPLLPVLVNLTGEPVQPYAGLEKVVEVVADDEPALQAARRRWKHYQTLGWSPSMHEIPAR